MKILLATDGSEFSEDAARFLTRFRFSVEDEILILHVISEIPFEDDYDAQVQFAIRRVAPKIFRDTVRILRPTGAQLLTLEKKGYPDSSIIETAVDYGADLIVMGPRGVKGLKLLVLGSSTRAVAINSPVPLLVVRNPRAASGPLKILFATDGSDAAGRTAELISKLPLPEDSVITAVNIAVSALSDIPQRYAAELGMVIKEDPLRLKRARARSDEIVERSTAALAGFRNLDKLFSIGDPFREILKIEEEIRPDVVAVGCRGLRGIKGMMGSLTRKLLSHSETSILIGKACEKVFSPEYHRSSVRS